MPVTDAPGDDDDWLQQFMAGHQAGQVFGASQPYGPGGMPGPYSGGQQGLMPGGGLYGRTQTTPGAPSMGYPAMGQPQPPAAAAQGDLHPSQMVKTAGLSLSSNPLTGVLNWLRGGGAPSGGGTPPLPANALPLAWGNPTGDDYRKWLEMQLGAGSSAPAPSGQPGYLGNTGVHMPPRPPDSHSSQGGGYPSPAAPATAPPAPARSPGAGAPAGNPSQTPQPANSSRFAMIDRVNAGPVSQPGRGYQTALDLSGLFGGRGQQANPANMPAANAQPVSGPLSSSAPWGMGPLQKGFVWPGAMGPFTQDQLAGRGLRQRYG